jgi:hypothetical protein
MTLYSQKDTIIYNGVKYKVEKITLLYKDTIYFCEKDINFRFTKDTIYVYKPRYYKKIIRTKI